MLSIIFDDDSEQNFGNGCSSHLVGGSYADGNMALYVTFVKLHYTTPHVTSLMVFIVPFLAPFSPDQGTFIIENTTFSDGAILEANHHCNVGITGVLCMPQYIFHNVHWKNAAPNWMYFQSGNTQGKTQYPLSRLHVIFSLHVD